MRINKPELGLFILIFQDIISPFIERILHEIHC